MHILTIRAILEDVTYILVVASERVLTPSLAIVAA